MKCNKCGFESERDFEYCMNCGTKAKDDKAVPVEAVSLNPVADKVLNALKDNLFLALCILMSASCVLSLNGGLPLINILITIFLWLTYADTQKGFANEKHLQCVSGTVYASYIITNVACGILIVCGVLFGGIFALFANTPEFISEFEVALSEYDLSEFGVQISDIPQALLAMSGWIIAFVFIAISAIGLIFNLLGMRKIHRFAKSVYQGIMYQNPNFENPRVVKNWLLFFGICSAISAVSSLASGGIIAALATGCVAASEIIAYILIDRYFVEKTNYTL